MAASNAQSVGAPYQSDSGRWYVSVAVVGLRQEFKFDHKPTEADLAFAMAEMVRQHFPLDDSIFTREIDPNGTG